MCIIILCVQTNLYYSCPIINNQICKFRLMHVSRSSLVGIKRQRQAGGLSNRLNIIIIKLKFPPKNALTAVLDVFLILTYEKIFLLYYFHALSLCRQRHNNNSTCFFSFRSMGRIVSIVFQLFTVTLNLTYGIHRQLFTGSTYRIVPKYTRMCTLKLEI
jgi:hypothetical protein